MFLVIIGWNYY